VSKKWTPAHRLQKAREREHVLSALVVALGQWPRVLESIESAASADEARVAVCEEFDFTWEQAQLETDL
jgi:DNA gyrase/topoisomerase IV subunit A